MEVFQNLGLGFSQSLAPLNILYCLIGVALGTAVGVLPGLGPTATISMLLPITFRMDMTSAIIMIAGIYYGSMYGGSITSILVNVPGEASSVITCLDGYQMARKGRAGPALGIAAFGSFIAGTIATLGLSFLAPPMARFALSFGPPEFTSLVVLGLTLVTYLSPGSMLKSLMMAIVGLLLACVGLDPILGLDRFTFGSQSLADGINVAILCMGFFGITEVLSIAYSGQERVDVIQKGTEFRNLLPNPQDWRESRGPILRGSFLGFFLGLLPGGGTLISSLASYIVEKKISKDPGKFGTGAIEGVAGPESANNSAAQAAFVPLMILGIPSNVVMAVIMGALMIQGVIPGPMAFKEHPAMFWGVITSMYIGNFLLIILNVPLIAMFVRILRVPQAILSSLIILFCFIGAYSLRNNPVDVVMMSICGIIGFVFRRLGLDTAPLILAFVLGTILEGSLRQSLLIGLGSPFILLRRPISALFLITALALLGTSFLSFLFQKRPNHISEKPKTLEGGE